METKYLEMELKTSPHFSKGISVEKIMLHVVLALLPVIAVSYYTFGISALALVLSTLITCLITERIICLMKSQSSTLGDYSAAITGILLGLTLPPGFPIWMASFGAIISILLGKVLFGGLGFNIFNPALIGRAFLQATFPVSITTWSQAFTPDRFSKFIHSTLTLPFTRVASDVVTGATPLSAMKFDHQATAIQDLLWGNISGSAGETCAVIILLAGLYLAIRKMLDWRIPTGILTSAFVTSSILHWFNNQYPSPWFMLFAGGLMLGAVFMATDMVTSPVTSVGVWVYSIIIGVLVIVIRIWGGLPEGVMYAILLGNAITPLLNQFTQPKIYGTRRNK